MLNQSKDGGSQEIELTNLFGSSWKHEKGEPNYFNSFLKNIQIISII